MSERIEGFSSNGSKTDFNERCNNDHFIVEKDTQLTEGKTTQDNVWQTQDNYFMRNMLLIKSDSPCDLTTENDLSEKNREKKINELQKDNITVFDRFEDKPIIDVPHTKVQRCQLSISENCLSLSDNEHFYNLSSCRTSLSLPAIPISCTHEKKTVFNESHEKKNFLCNMQPMNEEMFYPCKSNRLEYEYDTNKCQTWIGTRDASTIEQDNEKVIDSQLQTNNNEILNKPVQELKDVYKETELKPSITLNSNVRNNLISQSTLANDSKLVKIPLLTSPINIMQSNVQLLNKSRDFFNYITEKSTNIMEKALLPQHLSMKYNHLPKPIEKDITKTLSANKMASSIDIMSSIDTNLISNLDNIVRKQSSDTNMDKLDNAIINKSLFPKSCKKENKQYDNIKENTECLYNNDLEDAALSNEKDHILEKNDINELSSDIGGGQTERNMVVTKINVKCEKQISLQTEKIDNDNRQCKKNSSDICTPTDTNILRCDLLEHPLYSMLLENYTCLKNQNLKLLEKMEYLERSKQSNEVFEETQINTNTFSLQVGSLEKTIDKLTTELNTSLVTQETLKNERMAANKEKENMVMKYVISEKQLIDSQRLKDSAERKIKEILKDQELLQNKLRQTQDERIRINNILDGKCHQVTDFRKEIENLKEDIKLKEIKLKWTQNKLHSEMDLQKDTQQKLDKALMKINNMKEECEQIRRETQESFRKFQQSEENKAVTLDQQLKEHQARLILERYVTEDKEVLRLQLQKEMEILKSRQKDLIEENKRLNFKIEEFEKARLNYEENLSDLKIVAAQRQEQITELSNKLSQSEILKLQLQHKEEYVTSVEAEIQQLRLVNEDLQSDMQACRQKEADMLNFTQKLTDKNVGLQSDFITIQAKANRLESEHDPLHKCINELINKIKTLEKDLIQERNKRKEECEILATHLAEQTQLAQNFAYKLEDSEGENVVLKRKHQISLKELTRELQQCRGKLEIFETASPSNSLDVISRTGSNTSLNTGDTSNNTLTDNDTNCEHAVEPNRKVLMDCIIKLQKINIKRAEKLDFLEEHTQALTEELQKKKKIIQNYILNQNYGALGCSERDRNKAELARHGGIMASFYNNRVSDENMTLELSLEINKKLQAVLEDTLLKNITLKDNIDTLGNEIARLQNNLNKDRLKVNN